MIRLINLVKTRFNFALASGTITVLGLMVGLYSGTHMKLVVVGGVLTIAIADAFSDALGFHISKEAEKIQVRGAVWLSTIASFLFKFFFILTFIIPFVFFSLQTAVIISIAWGVLVIGLISYILSIEQGKKPFYVILEHVSITCLVIVLTFFAGRWIFFNFGVGAV